MEPKTKPDNPQAFPRTHSHGPSADGMTLRDWFAGQALAGIRAAGACNVSNYGAATYWSSSDVAKMARADADALLSELERNT
jgi:hypothetical protein